MKTIWLNLKWAGMNQCLGLLALGFLLNMMTLEGLRAAEPAVSQSPV